MEKHNRRDVLQTVTALALPLGFLSLTSRFVQADTPETQPSDSDGASVSDKNTETSRTNDQSMNVRYLEIVTPKVNGMCRQYEAIYGIKFSTPNASLGGARTGKLDGGGLIGIRGSLRSTETPVVRPYLLVDDIKSAVDSAAAAGAEIAMPPTPIPEHGKFAIVIHGGIECGFWQD